MSWLDVDLRLDLTNQNELVSIHTMGMFNFLQGSNNWILIGTTVCDPQAIPQDILSKADEKLLEKLLFGYTTYVWQNEKTGSIRKEEFSGVDEPPLRALLNKVDNWGRYEITLDGKKYVIDRLPSPPTLTAIEPSPTTPTIIPITDISRLPVR